MFVDTHCHLDDLRYNNVGLVVNEYLKNNVEFVIQMGCDKESSLKARQLSETYQSIYFACGIHPEFANEKIENLSFIDGLTSHKKCVAIGEIGLDFHYEGYNKNNQINTFEFQLDKAKEYNLPVCIHSRDATLDVITVLKNNREKLGYGGVMHCFSGSVETAKIFLDLGLYISFAGPITFKNAGKILDVVKYVPLNRCLSETDSPYLTPHPFRGTLNSPKNVSFVTKMIADVKGLDIENVSLAIKESALKLFYKINQ